MSDTKEGWEEVEDSLCPGRLTTSSANENMQKISEVDWNDHCVSFRTIAEIVMDNNKETIRQVLQENLNISKVCAKIVQKMLLMEELWKSVCSDLLKQLQKHPNFLERVVTCDKSWIFKYYCEAKHQSVH